MQGGDIDGVRQKVRDEEGSHKEGDKEEII
jgi:hypothetical protein